MKYLVAFGLLLSLSLGTVHAQDAGFAVLRLGTNAAAMAMGDAQTAASNDAYATYWNPAGLAAATQNSIGVSSRLWIADTRTYAATTRFGWGTHGAVGFFVNATDSGDLEVRSQPGDAEGTFSVQELSTGVAYGRRFGALRVGATAKYLAQRLFGFNASGYAFDFGAQANLPANVTVGITAQNLGKMEDLEAEPTPLPRLVRGGATFVPLTITAEDDDASVLRTTLTIEASHVFPNDDTQLHFGLAAEVLELVTLRAGYITNEALRELTFGAGLTYNALRFDYAFLPFESGFAGDGHVLSLLYAW